MCNLGMGTDLVDNAFLSRGTRGGPKTGLLGESVAFQLNFPANRFVGRSREPRLDEPGQDLAGC